MYLVPLFALAAAQSTTFNLVLYVAAAVILVAYIARRRSRKARESRS